MTDDDDELLSIKDAAERIGLKRNTLFKQIHRGAMKVSKADRGYVVTVGELRRYEREHKGKRGFASPDHPLYGKSRGSSPKRDADS